MFGGANLFFPHFLKSEKCLFSSENDGTRFLIVSNAVSVYGLNGGSGWSPKNVWLTLTEDEGIKK